MSDTLKAILKQYWGYESFRPLQERAMRAVESGRDSLVVMPTGGGKSLCFQVPAMAMEGLAVVVSPLISLMKDQVDALLECGIGAARVDSSQTPEENREAMRGAAEGKVRILYVSPERLVSGGFAAFLKTLRLSMIAIDEAHCISMWGHDFRPEYSQLGSLRDFFPGVGLHAYTATATAQVRDDIVLRLGLRDPEILVGSFDRPNLFYRAEERGNLQEQVAAAIARHRGESGIVYCISRRAVEEMCGKLVAGGVSALPYHAGLDDASRKANQDAFIHDRADIIVATVAFGMGIDKPDVRFVIHAGMPQSLEHYQQESGRAGRDGLEAECCLFYSAADIMTWRLINKELEPEQAAIAGRKLDAMYAYCAGASCRHKALLRHFEQESGADRCGACDICAGEVAAMPDALVTAQKILSCVIRLRERFGADYVSKVLTGSKDERIVASGHDGLSTWGILSSSPQRAVRNWIEQLAAQGFLRREGDYGVLAVTEAGRQALKSQATPLLTLRKETPRKRKRSETAAAPAMGGDESMFEALRSLRRRVADDKGVPAYLVFPDITLRDLAARRPTTKAHFLQISGVGQKKADAYSSLFLEFIVKESGSLGLETDRGFMEGIQ
jgi:ATP-dependent DNA helicase RecQ